MRRSQAATRNLLTVISQYMIACRHVATAVHRCWRRARQCLFSSRLPPLRTPPHPLGPPSDLRTMPRLLSRTASARLRNLWFAQSARNHSRHKRGRRNTLDLPRLHHPHLPLRTAPAATPPTAAQSSAPSSSKFERIDPLAAYFGEQLASVAKRHSLAATADVVVPVPLHRTRERERL